MAAGAQFSDVSDTLYCYESKTLEASEKSFLVVG